MSSKIIGCGALFYTLDTQRFLVLHRVQSKQNHVWGLVGGTTVDENFLYHTFLCVVENEFIPKLNTEHDGYAWVSFGNWPKPLHQGLRKTLQNKMNQVKLDTVFKMLKLM